MSLYRRPGSKIWSYDFRVNGHRFSGPTGETERRKAEAFERAEKARIKAEAIDKAKPLTFAAAATVWWTEAGQFHRNSVDTVRSLAWLQQHVGKARAISTITDATVAELVARRRADGVANATVNRQVLEPLRGILRRAAAIPGQRVQNINWRAHKLREAQERIREMTMEEEAMFFGALREDWHPLFRFALLSGCRLAEIVDLRWRDIDWHGRKFTVTGKGDRQRAIPLSMAIKNVLTPLPRAAAQVFTYERQKTTSRDQPRGARVPVSYETVKTVHQRTCAKAGIADFRFHDFRHTAATRMLRANGNLKHVQLLLGHTDIKTTSRYAHVTMADLRSAMENMNAAIGYPGDGLLLEDDGRIHKDRPHKG